MNLTCNRCGLDGEPRLRFTNHSSGRHLGAWCPACESWIKWVPQNDEWLAALEQQRNHPMHPETWTREYAE